MKPVQQCVAAAAIFSEVERNLIFSAPPNHDGPNVNLLAAETLIPNLRTPRITVPSANRQGFIAEIPSDGREGFVRSVLVRAYYRGEIHTALEWCDVLAADGVGHKDQATGTVQPISETTFRAEWRELAEQTYIPLISRAEADWKLGFGVARTREQIRQHEVQLRGRAAAMQLQLDQGFEILGANDGWFSGNHEVKVSGKRWGGEDRVALVIGELSKRIHTNGEIALLLATGESIKQREGRSLRAEGSEPGVIYENRESELARYETLCGSLVREFIAELRLAGVALCGNSQGYWIATDQDEYRDWLGHPHRIKDGSEEIVMHTGLWGRIEAVLEHADRLPMVMKLWFARNNQERQEALGFIAGAPKAFPLSARSQERKRLRLKAGQVRRQEAAHEEASEWLEQAREHTQSKWDQYQESSRRIEDFRIAPNPANRPTSRDHQIVRQYENARKVLQMKYPKKQTIKAGQTPAPWEQTPEQLGSVKIRGVKTASAASLASGGAVAPVPWSA